MKFHLVMLAANTMFAAANLAILMDDPTAGLNGVGLGVAGMAALYHGAGYLMAIWGEDEERGPAAGA